MNEHSKRLLATFVKEVVAPGAPACGLQDTVKKMSSCLSRMPRAGGTSVEMDNKSKEDADERSMAQLGARLAKEMKCKRVRVGVQKCTIVDSRLTLHQSGAYRIDPKSILHV